MKVYILRVFSGNTDITSQKAIHIAINDFITSKFGEFNNGILYIPDDIYIPNPYIIDRAEYESMISCEFIDDIINWLKEMNIWSEWMNNWENVRIEKFEVDNIGGM